MTSNEQLRLAYVRYGVDREGTKALRKEFSELLGLPVTEAGRTPTLDNWLAPEESLNFRKCPDPIARFARIAVILDRNLVVLWSGRHLPDSDFYEIESLLNPTRREINEQSETT